jgi:hypothetical protein
MLELLKFHTIWERRRFESITSSWAKPVSHTRTSPVGVALDDLLLRFLNNLWAWAEPHNQGATESQVTQGMPA